MNNIHRRAGMTALSITCGIIICACLSMTCAPYARKYREQKPVRVALLCGVDRVTISGRDQDRPYDGYTVTLNNAFPLFVSPRGSFVEVNGSPYRGSLELKLLDERIWVVNVLDIDDYVKGVVPCEIGRTPEDLYEVAKAQAVAARTYAYAHLDQHEELGFDLYSSIQDQVYKGVRCETELTNRAVEATNREILAFRGQPAETKYHSTCGGRTADFNDAWPGTAPSYLRSVPCPYCSASPHYRWEKTYARSDFFTHLRRGMEKIGIPLPPHVRIRNIKLVRNKKSKRIVKLVVVTDTGHLEVPGYQVRTVLGSPGDPGGLLRSNCFTLKTAKDAVTVTGSGWGHGVGMCQYGAMEMARRGMDYRKILYHYYRGTRLSTIR